jgi:excisionase family DNA binding protein
LLTSYQVGSLLQVNPSSINKWIKDGKIPAFRTPGGHRRIRANDLVKFLTEHNIPIPEGLLALVKDRLLMVSSDPDFITTFEQQRLLEQHRWQCTIVPSNLVAFLKVGFVKPRVMILDLDDTSIGIEASRAIKEISEYEKIELFWMGRVVSAEQIDLAKGLGCRGIFGKPLEWSQLLGALEK